MRKLLILVCIVLGLSSTQAQEAQDYRFTLEEAISFALDSNYTAINARRDIAIAIKQKWETTATGLPQISANVQYQNFIKQPVSLLPAAAFDNTSSVVNTVEDFFDLSPNRDPVAPEGFIPIVFGTQQQATATATLNQLIFDGSYLVGLQAAKTFLEFSENSNEKTQLEVRRGVINAYGSVLLADELVGIFSRNKEKLEKNLYEAQKIFENGLNEQEEVEQLEITLLEVSTQLSNSERTASIARQMFNVALGIDVNTPVVLTESLDDLADDNIQLQTLESSLNIEENVDYKIAFNLTEQRSLELKLEKSRALPQLSAFLNYGTQAFSDDFSFFNSDQRWFQQSLFGLNMEIPIFSSGNRGARTQQARIALDQAETQLEETIQNIELQYETARSNYKFSVESYENSKKNLSLATRIEQKNQIKFDEGISSSFELRQAQLQLYTAQERYFNAMLTVLNTKADLDIIINSNIINNN